MWVSCMKDMSGATDEIMMKPGEMMHSYRIFSLPHWLTPPLPWHKVACSVTLRKASFLGTSCLFLPCCDASGVNLAASFFLKHPQTSRISRETLALLHHNVFVFCIFTRCYDFLFIFFPTCKYLCHGQPAKWSDLSLNCLSFCSIALLSCVFFILKCVN